MGNPSGPEVLVVLVSCPRERAQDLAAHLVETGEAACVNILPAIDSVYRWEGKVQRDGEALLLIKTTAARFDSLKAAVLARHPYELPEVIGLPVTAAHVPFIEWVVKSCK